MDGSKAAACKSAGHNSSNVTAPILSLLTSSRFFNILTTLKKLSTAYEEISRDISKDGFQTLPIPVGYPQRDEVALPGHEAYLEPLSREGISYNGRAGWANDWVTNWTSTQAYPWWDIEVKNPGRFEVTLMYICSKENVGVKVRVEAGSESLEGVVKKEHNPDHIPSPDRVPRGEVYEKIWASLTLGNVELNKGRTKLKVKVLEIPGKMAFDLKAVKLRLID